jgi:hypothetical protein
MSTRPKKVHSTIKAKELQRVGWIISSAFVAESDSEPYEYILDWSHDYDPPFLELSTVELVRVTDISSSYMSSEGIGRTPKVGDIGVVVHCFPYNGKTNVYEVECVGCAGETIWLATFEHDDLKQVMV